jgi:hypothetical protein
MGQQSKEESPFQHEVEVTALHSGEASEASGMMQNCLVTTLNNWASKKVCASNR